MTRYLDIDQVDVPDQWSDIVERTEAGALLDLEPDTPRRRARRVVPAIAIAATVLAAAIAAGVLLDGDRTDVATTDDSSPQNDESLPDLVCAGGDLDPGSLPEDAVLGAEPLYTASRVQGTVSWAWQVGEHRVQVNVPGIPWAGVEGPTEPIAEPPGSIQLHSTSTVFVGTTGLPEDAGCGSFDVMVGGGTRARAREVALDVARSIRWHPFDVGAEGVRNARWARLSAVAAVSGWSEYPGPVEVATVEVEVDESFRDLLGLEAGNPSLTSAYVTVVRAADGSRLTPRGMHREIAELMLFVDGVGEHPYALRSGFSDASEVAEMTGRPYEEIHAWVPAVPLPPSWFEGRDPG